MDTPSNRGRAARNRAGRRSGVRSDLGFGIRPLDDHGVRDQVDRAAARGDRRTLARLAFTIDDFAATFARGTSDRVAYAAAVRYVRDALAATGDTPDALDVATTARDLLRAGGHCGTEGPQGDHVENLLIERPVLRLVDTLTAAPVAPPAPALSAR